MFRTAFLIACIAGLYQLDGMQSANEFELVIAGHVLAVETLG
jgi:hypothetical protein